MFCLAHTCPNWGLVLNDKTDEYLIVNKTANKELTVNGNIFRSALEDAISFLPGVSAFVRAAQHLWDRETAT